ncbi:MAG TPA: hypothetical protein VGH28_18610 [Polyangiaceae bacterium]
MKKIFATFAFATLLASSARANSRLPETNQLVSAPDDPSTLLLRTTFGYLFTHDAGKNWDWLCESAIPEQGQQDPAVALLAGGVVVSAQVVEGLAVSPDRGCSWSFASKMPAIDVARSPDGATAIALTSVYAFTDGGTIFNTTQMLETTDAGKNWAPLSGAIDPTLVIDTIDLAPSNPARMYVTGHVYQVPNGTMLVSSDGGQSWVSRSIPFVAGEASAYIAAVDPNNPDLVYARTLGTTSKTAEQFSRLLVTKDAGQTWNEAWNGDKLLGFALSADGSRVYVGTALAGLLAANASDLVFTQKSPLQIQCLATVGATLYACGNEGNSGWVLASTTDEGATFMPLLKLETIRGPLACAAGTSGAECVNEWPALADQLGIDAGTSPAPDAGGPSAGCGCESSSPTPLDLVVLGALIALGLTLRSRLFRAAR